LCVFGGDFFQAERAAEKEAGWCRGPGRSCGCGWWCSSASYCDPSLLDRERHRVKDLCVGFGRDRYDKLRRRVILPIDASVPGQQQPFYAFPRLHCSVFVRARCQPGMLAKLSRVFHQLLPKPAPSLRFRGPGGK
jgi:hypothetical protein